MKYLNKEKFFLIVSIIPAILMFCITRNIRVKLFCGILFMVCVIYIVFLLKNFHINKNFFKEKKALILSLFIEAGSFLDFFLIYQHDIPNKLYNIPFISPYITLALIGIVFCIIDYFAIYVLSKKLISVIISYLKIFKKYKTHFIVLTGIYFISCVSIFRANFYYIDDLGRTVYGYAITGDFSRYVADFCSKSLHMNSWLADISPLPQVIALCIMGLAGIILLSVFSFEKTANIWAVCSLVPLAINPYFLRCLSYKYDTPYMALSVLASVAPIIFYKKSSIKYGLTVFWSTLIMCTTYQSSSGIFPMIVTIMCLILWNKKESIKKIGKFLLTSAVAYILGMLVFRFLLMTPIDSTSSYVDTKIAISQIIPNVFKYLNLVISDYNCIWLLFICLLVVCFIFLEITKTRQNKYLSLPINIIMTFLALVLSFGVYIIFENLYSDPRYMYGIGVYFSIISIPLFITDKHFIGKLSSFLLSWSFIVFSFIYGNALSSQKEYTKFRTEQVVTELSESGILDENTKFNIQIDGTIGFSESVENMINEYPILEKIVPVMFKDSSWVWGAYKLINYYDLNLQICDDKTLNNYDLQIIKDTYYYCIKSDKKNYILIQLKTVGK